MELCPSNERRLTLLVRSVSPEGSVACRRHRGLVELQVE